MKIAVSTIIGDNYGSVLQAFALQKTFQDFDLDSFLLKIKDENRLKRFIRIILKSGNKTNLRLNIKKIVSDLKNNEKNRKIKLFYKNNVQIHEYKNIHALEKGEMSTNIFCCGSDQVWNPAFQPSALLYLDFKTNDNAVYYSYAASLAQTDISDKAEMYYKESLSKFKSISIREEAGRELMTRLLPDKKTRTDVDPVLLKDNEFWTSLCSERFTGQKYIFLYMLRPIPKMVRIAKDFSKKMNLPIYYIGDYYISENGIYSIYDASVEDFLDIIRNASLVLTNSFHATVFSIIFNRNFYSYAVSGTGSRVLSLLKKLNLLDRILDLDTNIEIDKNIQDWDIINNYLEDMRNDSLKYIRYIAKEEGDINVPCVEK